MGNVPAEPIRTVAAEEEADEELNEDEYDAEEETEEEWLRRREGDKVMTRLDWIKRLLAIAFFTGLGLIVVIVAATATPLIIADEELSTNTSLPTLSPTQRPTKSG